MGDGCRSVQGNGRKLQAYPTSMAEREELDPTFSTLKDPRKYWFPQKFCGFGGDGSASGARLMSALPPKADKERTCRDVRFVTKADICAMAPRSVLTAKVLGYKWGRG